MLPGVANLLWHEFGGNAALLDGLKQAMSNQGLRAALNTLRCVPVRASAEMDPLVFCGYIQGYHAAIDTLMALAQTNLPDGSIQPDFLTPN